MAQVYAIVHDGKGNFIIATKNFRGYYFHDPKKPREGSILPKGKILNGAAKRAFPGGHLESAEINRATIIAGASAELFEETEAHPVDAYPAPDFYSGTGGAYY